MQCLHIYQRGTANFIRGEQCNKQATPNTQFCNSHRTSRHPRSNGNNDPFEQYLNYSSDEEDDNDMAIIDEEEPEHGNAIIYGDTSRTELLKKVKAHYCGPRVKCPHCGALMWYGERSKGSSKQNPVFTKCCRGGTVVLQPYSDPPVELRNLFQNEAFVEDIRAYNNLMAFASTGANIDEALLSRKGSGKYSFRINGSMYHLISDFPMYGPEFSPKFAQIYFVDNATEAANLRQRILKHTSQEIIRKLQHALAACNPFVKIFSNPNVRNLIKSNQMSEFKLVLKSIVPTATNRLPTAAEVAAIVPYSETVGINSRDIVLTQRNPPKYFHINEYHMFYDALAYPLLFPLGDSGWHLNLKTTADKALTLMKYYSFRFHERENAKYFFLSGKLFHQFIVDSFCKMEQNRLSYNRKQEVQSKYRSVTLAGLNDALIGNENLKHMGTKVILPSTYVGGPRYMHQLYHDSMAIVREYGKPDFFITMTCNPDWPEIVEALQGQKWNHRPDIIVRQFQLKYEALLKEIIEGKVFGKIKARIKVIEFQKRGLPHVHILIFLHDSITTVERVDMFVSAEIPSENDPELRDLVLKHMMHKTCESCFSQEKQCCTKGFPKEFCSETSFSDGYPLYRRRQTEPVTVNRKSYDNSRVVPFNPYLLKKYQCHINVEVCSSIKAIKYVFKYIFKGPDTADCSIQNKDDEIQTYLNSRYVSATEALWRIYSFDTVSLYPAVIRLDIHLPNQQRLLIQEDKNLTPQEIIRQSTTKLIGYFNLNKIDQEAHQYLYRDIPKHYTWNATDKVWKKRQYQQCIGRIYFVSPTDQERYYLRLLLDHVKKATCYEDLRTVNGTLHHSFREAAKALGLLKDDKELILCMEEATNFATSKSLRNLFCTILTYCSPAAPETLWDRFKDDMLGDFRYRRSVDPLRDAIKDISSCLKEMNNDLRNFPTLPQDDDIDIDEEFGHTINVSELRETIKKLNAFQKPIYEEITADMEINDVHNQYFIHGSGGSGKSFLLNALIMNVIMQGKKFISLATTGIASQQLIGAQTAHSFFKLPLDIQAETNLKIDADSAIARAIRKACIIIIDEAFTANRYIFEALDRAFRDIMRVENSVLEKHPFGGKLVVLGGHTHQTLPIIEWASRSKIVNNTLKRSHLWNVLQHRSLGHSMRLSQNDVDADKYYEFCQKVGDGSNFINEGSPYIELPDVVTQFDNDIESLIHKVFPDLNNTSGCAILATLNKEADQINDTIFDMIPSTPVTFYSIDGVDKDDKMANSVSLDYLNSLRLKGMPVHELKLKTNTIIMVLRNLNTKRGLANGTLMKITQLKKHVIEGIVLNGTRKGTRHCIPRITLYSNQKDIPFKMSRHQFPVCLAYAMTINKSQGQSLDRVGIVQTTDVFAHGQLYVALTRAKDPRKCFVLTNPVSENRTHVKNFVYEEVLYPSKTERGPVNEEASTSSSTVVGIDKRPQHEIDDAGDDIQAVEDVETEYEDPDPNDIKGKGKKVPKKGASAKPKAKKARNN